VTAPDWTDEGADVADLAVRLCAEFSDWVIVYSGGQWWANRGPAISERATGEGSIRAATAAELYLALEKARP
jgi:hypothetical protein